MKLSKTILIAVALLALVPIYFISHYQKVISSPIGEGTAKTEFEIEEGMTGDQVIAQLATQGIVKEKDSQYLKAYLRLNKIPAFQKGHFRIPANLTPIELFETLQNPENPDIWVTIPEGLRKDEIAEIFEEEFSGYENSVYDKEKFLSLTEDISFISSLDLGIEGITDLEGFLFPDKYLLPIEATEQYIITTLANTFKTKMGQVTYDQLIMASMVEREGYSNEDRPLIADVIAKRLAEGWLLQIDATLLYYHKDWKYPIVLEQEKKIDHPYNTYVHTGLPPTPICNPGASAMQAVLKPQANNYYYYIHDKDGNAHFGTTLAEHEANIAKYLR